ncbi:glycosyltransferase [Leptolyngbya sp. KIOST-1]|uniref:glycosyltransferase n=1 Tax=Leptolyngbya sp. KIOST-1 TaxID=1229172 RepID=UPI00056762F1|nr:glycosyltransferase [Leptolyngbya sp. KIOST-1]
MATQLEHGVKLPSFSIVVETENLSTAEIDGLSQCLDTLAAQDLSPDQANEVLILESGDVPEEVMQQLCARYTWLKVRKIEAGTNYYEAKMKGFSLVTGEILVLCDSDCQYESSWLRSLLTPFALDPEIQVVAGETSLAASSAYDIGIAITYIFPRFSRKRELDCSANYFCNNVAFRQKFLLSHPIPCDLPIYRGNCVVHAHSLANKGYQIWQQPSARAVHAAPNGLSHFFWRFLLLGYDALAVARMTGNPEQKDQLVANPLFDLVACVGITVRKTREVLQRTYRLIVEDPKRLVSLPLALPVVLASYGLFLVGLGIGFVRPRLLLNDDILEKYFEA